MKEFNFKTFQNWFNKNYSWAEMSEKEVEALPFEQEDFRLDEGWFPEDGESGMYKQGCEIAILVYDEGMDVGGNYQGHTDLVDTLSSEFPDLIEKSDLSSATKGRFNVECVFLPFKEKYIPIFEYVASDFCEAKPKISLKDYLTN